MSLDLSTLNGGDRIRSVSGATANIRFVTEDYVVAEPIDDTNPFCIVGDNLDCWFLVPPPPLIDPEQVWAITRRGGLEACSSVPECLTKGRSTHIRITAYEVVE